MLQIYYDTLGMRADTHNEHAPLGYQRYLKSKLPPETQKGLRMIYILIFPKIPLGSFWGRQVLFPGNMQFIVKYDEHFHRIGSIFGKRDLLAIDHIMLALFWSYVPNMK